MQEERDEVAPLLDRVREGHPAAARSLIEHFYPLVIRIVRSHRPVRVPEEDLAQDIFLKVFTRLDQYRARAGVPFAHWVSRLAVRTCLDALRAERRRPELRWADLPDEQARWIDYLTADTAAAPASSVAAARELVEKLLEQLAPPDRLVIRWLDLEGKSVREISAVTGWSVPLVKVRAFRARGKLRKIAAAYRKEWTYE